MCSFTVPSFNLVRTLVWLFFSLLKDKRSILHYLFQQSSWFINERISPKLPFSGPSERRKQSMQTQTQTNSWHFVVKHARAELTSTHVSGMHLPWEKIMNTSLDIPSTTINLITLSSVFVVIFIVSGGFTKWIFFLVCMQIQRSSFYLCCWEDSFVVWPIFTRHSS